MFKKNWSQRWYPGNGPVSPLSPKGLGGMRLEPYFSPGWSGTVVRFGPSNSVEGSCSWQQDCCGNCIKAQSQLFSSEEIRGFYNDILQERTTQYKVQNCTDNWGKDTSVILPIVTSSLLGYSWLYLSGLPFLPNHSWGYPDTIVNTSFIPSQPKVLRYH